MKRFIIILCVIAAIMFVIAIREVEVHTCMGRTYIGEIPKMVQQACEYHERVIKGRK